MEEITVDSKVVVKLLEGLDVHKATCPDGLNARVLKMCSKGLNLGTFNNIIFEFSTMTKEQLDQDRDRSHAGM